MSRVPADKTALKTARRVNKGLLIELARANATSAEYRIRATKAETEAADWKKRFDTLLSKGFSDSGDEKRG